MAMKKLIAILTAILMTGTLCACGRDTVAAPAPTEAPPAEIEFGKSVDIAPTEAPTIPLDPMELVGPWHLDREKNDESKLVELFSGYAEWGATMEIRSDGRMSWYIGAIGGSGTYTVEENTLTAELRDATKDESAAPQMPFTRSIGALQRRSIWRGALSPMTGNPHGSSGRSQLCSPHR